MLLAVLFLGVTGCGRSNGKDTQSTQTESELAKEDEIFLIVEHDSLEESMRLYSFSNKMELYYEYGFSTKFRDKFGNFASAAEFSEGRFVSIAPRDKDGYLTEVQLSDRVWEYEKVRRFQIDEENGILTIADTKYSIRDEVKIFSNGKEISFANCA